jgi:hypothetical protein
MRTTHWMITLFLAATLNAAFVWSADETPAAEQKNESGKLETIDGVPAAGGNKECPTQHNKKKCDHRNGENCPMHQGQKECTHKKSESCPHQQSEKLHGKSHKKCNYKHQDATHI